MKLSEKRKGVYSLILLALIFSSMGVFVRLLSVFQLFQQVYLRVFAALLLGLFIFNRHLNFSKLKKLSYREWLLFILRGSSGYLFGVTLFSQAIILTKYSNVSFIGAIPMTAVLGVILLKEKITIQKIFLIFISFIGVTLISVKDYSNLFSWGRGEIFALISTVFFSLNYIGRRWHSKTLNNSEITELNFFIGFIIVFIASFFVGEPLPMTGWNWGLLLAVLGGGFFNVINVFLSNYGFQKVDIVLASNILTLESAFAIIIRYIFYREIPGLKEIIGGLIILLSVIRMNYLDFKK